MVTVSNEYCSRCGDGRACTEEQFVGGVRWVCIDCGSTVDLIFNDDDDDGGGYVD